MSSRTKCDWAGGATGGAVWKRVGNRNSSVQDLTMLPKTKLFQILGALMKNE